MEECQNIYGVICNYPIFYIFPPIHSASLSSTTNSYLLIPSALFFKAHLVLEALSDYSQLMRSLLHFIPMETVVLFQYYTNYIGPF